MNNYYISSLKDLDLIRENPNDSFKLLNHIDLSDKEFFNPIERFNGVLDGNGYEIRNLTIKDNTLFEGYVGFFKIINSSGLIKNLTIRNVFIHSGHTVGSLASTNCGKVMNCKVIGENNICGGDYVGGLIGYNRDNGYIENVYISIKSLDGFNEVGGLVGLNESNINNCTVVAEGNIYKLKTKYKNIISVGVGIDGINGVGGLAGRNFGIIKKSVSFFNISCNKNAGGLVGINVDYENENKEKCAMSRVVDCKSFGIIRGKENMGGLAGFNDLSVIDNCVSDVKFNNCDKNFKSIGGVVGLNKGGKIINCKQEKNIYGNIFKERKYFYFDSNV